MEILDDESDVEDSSVGDEAHPHTGDGDGGSVRKLAFAIDPQIDINSRALLDMISDDAVVVDQPLPSAHVKMAAGADVTIDEAFDDW